MMRVLVCEDEDLMAELVRQALVEEGHDVEVVASGERAIDAVTQSAYDLVLLDVMLRGLMASPRVGGCVIGGAGCRC